MTLNGVANMAIAALVGVMVLAVLMVFTMKASLDSANKSLEYGAQLLYAADKNLAASKYNAVAASDNVQATRNVLKAAERAFPDPEP